MIRPACEKNPHALEVVVGGRVVLQRKRDRRSRAAACGGERAVIPKYLAEFLPKYSARSCSDKLTPPTARAKPTPSALTALRLPDSISGWRVA